MTTDSYKNSTLCIDGLIKTRTVSHLHTAAFLAYKLRTIRCQRFQISSLKTANIGFDYLYDICHIRGTGNFKT